MGSFPHSLLTSEFQGSQTCGRDDFGAPEKWAEVLHLYSWYGRKKLVLCRPPVKMNRTKKLKKKKKKHAKNSEDWKVKGKAKHGGSLFWTPTKFDSSGDRVALLRWQSTSDLRRDMVCSRISKSRCPTSCENTSRIYPDTTKCSKLNSRV